MVFDWTINVGTLVSAVVGAGTVLVAVIRYGIRLHRCLESRLDAHGARLSRIERRQRRTRWRMLRMHKENVARFDQLRQNTESGDDKGE